MGGELSPLQFLEYFNHTGGLNTRYSATSTPDYDALELLNIENVTRGGFRKINGWTRYVQQPITNTGTSAAGQVLPTAESDAWTGAGDADAASAVSGGIFTLTDNGSGAVRQRYFNAEAGFTTGVDATYETRWKVNSSTTPSGVYVVSICVLDDATKRFELVALDVSGVKQIGVLTTTADRTVIGSYSSVTTHDWSEFTRYRVEYDASDNVSVYVDDMTTALFTIAVSSLPASTETSRAAFGSFESAVNNVWSYDYIAYKIGALALDTVPITGIYSFVDETDVQLILVTAGTALYQYDGTVANWSAVTGGTAFTSGAKPHFVTFNDTTAANAAITIITTESRNTPQKYGGGATKANLGGSPPSGRYCEVYHERLFIANTAAEPSAVFFSAAGDPEDRDDGAGTWDTTNDVFLIDRHKFGEITGLKTVNDVLLVFCQRAIYRLQGWGKGSFLLEVVTGRHGCISPNSIVSGPLGNDRANGVYFRDYDGYYWTDGNIGTVIRVSEKILPTLQDDFSPTLVANICSVFDAERGYVSFADTLANSTQNDRVFSFDYLLGGQGQGDGNLIEGWFPSSQPMRCAGLVRASAGETIILFGDHVGLVQQANTGTDADGADIDSYRTTAWAHGGTRQLEKLFRYLIVYFKATGDIDVDVSWGINYQDDFSNQTTVNVAGSSFLLDSATNAILGTSTLGSAGVIKKKIELQVKGTAVRFKFGTDAKDEPFTVLGYVVAYKPLGFFEGM